MHASRPILVCLSLTVSACSPATEGHDAADRVGSDPDPDAGMGTPETPREPRTCDGTGESLFYLINLIDVGKPDDLGRVPGLDLDGRVSDAADPGGCRHPDFTSPPPDSETGVDNQLGLLARDLEGQVDISQQLHDFVEAGEPAVVAELSDVDSLTEDDCVQIEVSLGYLAEGSEAPETGPDGRPVSGATYDVQPVARFQGRITDGRVYSQRGDLSIALTDPTAATTVYDALGRFDVAPEGLTNGVIGGAMRVEDIQAAIDEYQPDLSDLASIVLRNHADLQPGADGCQALSAGFVFEAVDAVKGAVLD